jgi:hypothetical protein
MPQRRQQTFPLVLVGGVLALSALNGTFFSPLFDPLLFHVGPLADSLLIPRSANLHFTALLLAVFTLVLAGVPAALSERIFGTNGSSTISLLIWLLSAVILSWPTLSALMGPE